MKKFALLLLTAIISTMNVAAQTDQDYYLDFHGDNQKYWFSWNATMECYTLTLPKLDKNFKIYSSQYQQGGSNQDPYIYGAAENGQSGITEGVDLNLQHPGKDMQAQDGRVMYNVVFDFWPDKMKLRCVAGSPTPALAIAMETNATGIDKGDVFFTITPPSTAEPGQEYSVTLTYKDKNGQPQTQHLEITETKGSFGLENLAEGATTALSITVTTTINGTTLSSSADGSITTYIVPILVGQIKDHSWTPDYGIVGTPIEGEPGTYQFIVEFTGTAEFSFVTKLGDNWDIVNSSPRYSPSSNRVDAPANQWLDYQTFNGSTSNAWRVQDFSATQPVAIVYFSYPKKQVMVEGTYVTGVESAVADETPTDGPIYSITGAMVRSHSDSTDGLAPGIYIVNGHKMIVR